MGQLGSDMESMNPGILECGRQESKHSSIPSVLKELVHCLTRVWDLLGFKASDLTGKYPEAR